MFPGQPILRSAILAPAAEGTRLSAALANYPGYSLFPLPLDAMNLVAPDVSAFLPGDLVNITWKTQTWIHFYSWTFSYQPSDPGIAAWTE
jgi:hypothetical protein